jgi:hypothetical protein
MSGVKTLLLNFRLIFDAKINPISNRKLLKGIRKLLLIKLKITNDGIKNKNFSNIDIA